MAQEIRRPTGEGNRRIEPAKIQAKKLIRGASVGLVAKMVLRSRNATEFVLRTRDARLRAEAQSTSKARRRGESTFFQWVQNAAEIIPSPAGWGPGDVITLAESVVGRDVLGRKLAPHQRVLMGAASILPIIPGRVMLDSAKKVQDNVAREILRRRAGR